MKGLIFDYGATIDSNGKHWAEVIWDAYTRASLPLTKEQFREAYIYTERFLSINPELILPEYNFFELMQVRIGIQMDYLIQQEVFSIESLHTTLKIINDGEEIIFDNDDDVSQHFVDFIAGQCYDYARRCTLDALPMLDSLQDKYCIALVSNFYGNLASVLQDFGILRCFNHVIDSAQVGVRKPDPAIFQIAIDRMGIPVKDITVIGDSYNKDILPARSLGCNAIWIKGASWNPEADRHIDYEPSVSSLFQLLDMLS